MISDAILSDEPIPRYRYQLSRIWTPSAPIASIIMVNPSTADANEDDPTIRKLKGFTAKQGWGGFIVVNLHAFRATDVNALRQARDPIGPLNSGYILAAMLQTQVTVVAWGASGKLPASLRNSWRTVAALAQALNRPLHCWGVCADGHPKHPVMLGYDNPLIEWKAPL